MLKTSKRKNQLMDARASKHVKMGEPEVAFDHTVETEAINVYKLNKCLCSRVDASLA